MADTIIRETSGRDDSTGGAGWLIVAILLVALLVGVVVLYQNGVLTSAPAEEEGANINITVPTGATGEEN